MLELKAERTMEDEKKDDPSVGPNPQSRRAVMDKNLDETVCQSNETPKSNKYTFGPEATPLEGYTIKRAIHRGGFGEVYYALSDAGKEVALKLLKQNMEIELRGVSQCLNLKHANLVSIFDIRQDQDDDHWIVMEYMSGQSLDQVINDFGGPVPIEEIRTWIGGMAAGLDFLHDRGIVHRDLKPANVFIEDGVVKIGDVGLAKFISQSQRNAQTQSVGTVYYMAPEVAHGRYGKEVDVYSLGILLYELLTGKFPFDGESTAEILMKHLSEKPDLSDIPAALRPVIARALVKDPLKRTPSAGELHRDFERALDGKDFPTTIPEESFHASSVPPVPPIPSTTSTNVEEFATVHSNPRADRIAARHARIEQRRAVRQERHTKRRDLMESRRQNSNAKRQDRHVARKNQSRVFVANHAKQQTKSSSKPEDSPAAGMLKIFLFIFIFMALFARAGLVWKLFNIGILIGVGYLIYKLFFEKGKATQGSNAAQNPVAPPSVSQQQVAHVTTPRRHRKMRRILTPEAIRPITVRQKMTEVSSSMFCAVLVTALFAVGLALIPGFFETPTRVAFFVAVTILGSWAVLLVSKVYEGTTSSSSRRRFSTMIAGGLVGASVFFIGQYLLFDFTSQDASLITYSLPNELKERPVEGNYMNISSDLWRYVIFFAGLFVLRHWWKNADSFRRKRFSLGSVFLTGMVGLVLGLATGFNVAWAVLFSAAISCVVMLSSCTAIFDPEQLQDGNNLQYREIR